MRCPTPYTAVWTIQVGDKLLGQHPEHPRVRDDAVHKLAKVWADCLQKEAENHICVVIF